MGSKVGSKIGAPVENSAGSEVGSEWEPSRSLVPTMRELSRLWTYRVVDSARPLSLSRPLLVWVAFGLEGSSAGNRRPRGASWIPCPRGRSRPGASSSSRWPTTLIAGRRAWPFLGPLPARRRAAPPTGKAGGGKWQTGSGGAVRGAGRHGERSSRARRAAVCGLVDTIASFCGFGSFLMRCSTCWARERPPISAS